MITQDFSNYIDNSHNVVQIESGSFELTFSTIPGSVEVLIAKEGQPDVEVSVINNEPLASLSNAISLATKVNHHNGETTLGSDAASILRMIVNLLYYPVDYVLEKNYAKFIKLVKDAKPPLSITGGELVTTFTFSDNMLHVQSVTSNNECTIYHIGVEGKLDLIVNFIKNQYEKLNMQKPPTREKIYQTVRLLGGDVSTASVLIKD